MNRFEFYSRVSKYNSIQHDSFNKKYYKKLENAYGPNKSRYFYSKEEWDAYNKEKSANQSGNAERAKAEGEAYDKWKKQQEIDNDRPIKEVKMDHAKNHRKFDKAFLDMMSYEDNLSDEDRLKKYEEYLEDPEGYPKKYIINKLAELSKDGNVDLNNRPEISAKELVKAKWDVDEDGYATVFSMTYPNIDDTAFYNFTPIIIDPKTGKFLGVLSPDEFDRYCWDVIDDKREDDYNLQIGGRFDGKDAFERANNTAIKIHELHEELHELNKKSK